MKLVAKNVRQFIYYALCMSFGSLLTLSFMQIDSNKCIADLLKDENYSYYKVSKMQNPALIILIFSAPGNLERRTAIRETWLKLHATEKSDVRLKHFFVVGSVGLSADLMLHLSSEQSKFSDLLILPIEDKYASLSNKVLQSFVWLHEQVGYGLNYSFVLKCDDDTFVRTDLLRSDTKLFLEKYGRSPTKKEIQLNENIFSVNSQVNNGGKRSNQHLYWGYFSGNAKIKTRGKWKEDDWILCDNYLPYARGGGYVLSHGLVAYLARNSADLKLYKSEDVSVGTWLAPVSNVDRIHDVRFDTEWNTRGCSNLYVVSHKLSIADMRTMYKNIKEIGKPCTEEKLIRRHYLYDWNTLPSKCCTST